MAQGNDLGILRSPRKYTPQETTQIYTDWANHYLEKVKSKRRIHDLPHDVTDGVALADVIEAVTNQKLPDVNRKPKTATQMIDNISTCLGLLSALNIPIEDVAASDIHEGNLKSILTVFFALSRYKQQQKQQQQEMAKIPVAKTGTTSIPVCAGKKAMVSKIALPSGGHYVQGPPQLRPNSSTATSAASSRSASPSHSSIGGGNVPITGNSLIPKTSVQKIIPKSNSIKTPVAISQLNKQSMLDKLKLFKPLEKPQATLSKRPSSSSGFSSARSEQSDSSLASNPGNVTSPLTTLAVFDQPAKKPITNPQQNSSGTKERNVKLRSKNSPKVSPKVKRNQEVDESKADQIVMASKPLAVGSGIPKPTAAVKGTAKVVKKVNAVDETSAIERTPGDGKEVSATKITQKSTLKTTVNSTNDQLSKTSSQTDSSCVSLLGSQVRNSHGIKLTSELPSASDTTVQKEFQNCTRTESVAKIQSESQTTSSLNDTGNAATNNLCNELESLLDSELGQKEENQLVDECSSCLESGFGIQLTNKPQSRLDSESESKLGSSFPKQLDSRTANETGSRLGSGLHNRLNGVSGNGPVAKVSPMVSSAIEPPSETSNNHTCESSINEDDEEEAMNVQPMSPLLNTTNLSLIKRNNIAYASDNESSKASGTNRSIGDSYADSLDGYLSEGGATLYARKLHYFSVTHRNKEDDSFDDSSSLSSGISDPWNEVYGLQLKMDHSSVYPGYGTPLQNRRHPPVAMESSPYKQISSSQWKKFIEAGRLPSTEKFQTELWKNEHRERPRESRSQQDSPKRVEQKKISNIELAKRKVHSEVDTNERRQTVKGVPSSFGYVKKNSSNPSPMPLDSKRNELANGKGGITYKTANVATVPKLDEGRVSENLPSCYDRSLERPKTKLKVSGGTQTDMVSAPRSPKSCPTKPPASIKPHATSQQQYVSYSDSEYQSSNGVKFNVPPVATNKANFPPTFKSYSLTTPMATQLSQNIRERLQLSGTQSLPKSHLSYLKGIDDKRISHAHFAAHLFAGVTEFNGEIDLNLDSPVTHNGIMDKLRDKDKSIKYVASGRGHTDGSLSDTPYTSYWNKYGHSKNPNELLSDPESLDSVPLQTAKISWLANPPSPRLNRSNSVRSTKSEKLYPSMLQRNEEGELHYGVNLTEIPTVELPNTRYANSSPSGANSTSRSSLGNYSTLLSLSRMGSKEEDCHGSSLSLVSTASSLYSSQEEKQAAEIRKLRRELTEAQDKVNTLSGQLSTNAHVVAAFEQSLASMTSRLQSLTATAEQKESELQELRTFIEQLRKQGIEAGLVTNGSKPRETTSNSNLSIVRQLSSDSVSSVTSQMTNISSASSSSPSQPPPPSPSPSPSMKKKSWLRSSFSKAFSRSKRMQGQRGGGSDSEDCSSISGNAARWSAPSSPLLTTLHPHHIHHSSDDTPLTPEAIEELKKQLREKDMELTDIRLEALSSVHQLEALKETVSKMRNEMLSLKQDNERLQRQIEQNSSAQSSTHNSMERRVSRRLSPSSDVHITTNFMLGLEIDKESKSITVVVHVGDYDKVVMEDLENNNEWILGYTGVSGKTRWDALDESVKTLFVEYISQIDPATRLGLDAQCIWYYRVGEIVRYLTSDDVIETPELLPCGYLVGDCNCIHVFMRSSNQSNSPAYLALETLIPLPVLNRYITLLNEHRRIILCGPTGTGKSYLARKLAEYCVGKSRNSQPHIATFRVDAASCKEVRHFLTHMVELLGNGNSSEVPDVVILEDLHLAVSINEVFSPLTYLDSIQNNVKLPYFIGTTGPMNQSATTLQLQHNFRWILLANHMEPVQGLLSRFLRRRLIQSELKLKSRDVELNRIIEWIPRCWSHLNKFLEIHNSADVTIGPRWLLHVPSDSTCSQVWFTDLWNYTLGPYLLHAVREGLQLYGKRAAWEDPAQWVLSTYPWSQGIAHDALMRLRPEDVGYDTATRPRSLNTAEQDRDPLYTMLIKLQEAAGLPSPMENSEHSSESQNSNGELKE